MIYPQTNNTTPRNLKAKKATTPESEPSILSKSQRMLVEKALSLTSQQVDELNRKDFLTIEESQMLLIRMIEEEYERP